MGFLDILNNATKPIAKVLGGDPDKPAFKTQEPPEREGFVGKLEAASRFLDRVTGTAPIQIKRLRDYENWGSGAIQNDSDLHGQGAAGAAGKMQEALDNGDHASAMRHQAKVGEESTRAMYAASQAAMARDEQSRQQAEKQAQERQAIYDQERARRESAAQAPSGSPTEQPGFDVLAGAMAGRRSSQRQLVEFAQALDKTNKASGLATQPGALTLKEQMEAKVAQWNAAGVQKALRIDYSGAPRAPEGFRTDAENLAHREALDRFEAKARQDQFKAILPFLAGGGKARGPAQVQEASRDPRAPQGKVAAAMAPEELTRQQETRKEGAALIKRLLAEMEQDQATLLQKQRQRNQGSGLGL